MHMSEGPEKSTTALYSATWDRRNETIYLHRSSPPSESGLDKPENRYGRYGFASFSTVSMSTVGVDGARVSLWRFSFLSVWVVVVDVFQLPVGTTPIKKNSRSEKAILRATLGIPRNSPNNSGNGTHDLSYEKTLYLEELSERLSELVRHQKV